MIAPSGLLFRGADCSSQEGSVFAAHRGPFEGWDTLPLLDERVALKFIMPETHLLGWVTPLMLVKNIEELETFFSLKSAPYLPFLRPKNSSHVVIMGADHLVRTRNYNKSLALDQIFFTKLCHEVPQDTGTPYFE